MQTSQQLVSSFYLAYYGRPADVKGLAYWTQQLEESGGNLSDIVDAFANSAESTANFGGLTAPQHIAHLYQQLLSRSPEQAGAAYWLGEVDAGRITLAKMAISLYEGALGSDATTVQVRQQVADQFTAALAANGTGYSGLAAVEAARLVIQAANANTSAADIAGLAQAGVTLAANTSANPSILTALIGANGSLMDLLATPVGTANPLALVNLVNTIVATAAGNSASVSTLLGAKTLTDVITNLPSGVTLTSLETAIDTGGFNSGSVVINPTTPDYGGGSGEPAAPPFVVNVENDGKGMSVITFSGSATGDITVSTTETEIDGEPAIVATFSRGGFQATTKPILDDYSRIDVAEGQTLTATAAVIGEMNDIYIYGDGTVAVTALEEKLDVDLDYIVTAVLTAEVTTSADAPLYFEGYLGNAKLIISGDGVIDFIEEYGDMEDAASFEIGAGSTLILNESDADGKTATGTGAITVMFDSPRDDDYGFRGDFDSFGYDYDPSEDDFDSSKFSEDLMVTLKVTDPDGDEGTFDFSEYTNLENVDVYSVGENQELILTAAQANEVEINGEGGVTIIGVDGAQTLKVETTGTNTIDGGQGADAITLGTDTGEDVVIVFAGTAATGPAKQKDSLTLSGRYEIGDKVTVKGVATEDVTYTVVAADLAGDDAAGLSAIAAKLVLAINAATGSQVTAATTASAGMLTIEAQTAGIPFTAIISASGAETPDNTQNFSRETTTSNVAPDPGPAVAQVETVTLSGVYEVGDTVNVGGIGSVSVSYTVKAEDLTGDAVADLQAIAVKIVAAINVPSSTQATAAAIGDGKLTLTAKNTGYTIDGVGFAVTNSSYGDSTQAAARGEITKNTTTSTPAIASDSYWSTDGGTWDTIANFGTGDTLDLDGDVMLTTGAGITDGIAAVSGAELADKLTALATLVAETKTVAAFVHDGNTYVFQGDGDAGVQDSDVFIQLTGVTLTTLVDIWFGPL